MGIPDDAFRASETVRKTVDLDVGGGGPRALFPLQTTFELIQSLVKSQVVSSGHGSLHTMAFLAIRSEARRRVRRMPATPKCRWMLIDRRIGHPSGPADNGSAADDPMAVLSKV